MKNNSKTQNNSFSVSQEKLLDICLGPIIKNYLKRNDIKEIMLNPDGKIWIETIKEGKIPTEHSCSRLDAKRIISIIASLNEKIISSNNPVISGTLKIYQARFQGWLPPISDEPIFCIRKQITVPMTLNEWITQGSMSLKQKKIIDHALKEKKNIIICGGTGSGKTTLTNTLLRQIGETNERIITIEDTRELCIYAHDHVSLLTTQDFTLQDCLAGTLRMRPDRIIIGEVRDKAALDLLKAWNTGHGGGIATLHANSPAGALQRLEDLSMEGSHHKPSQLIGEVVNLILYIERTHSGIPAIKNMVTVAGFKDNQYILFNET